MSRYPVTAISLCNGLGPDTKRVLAGLAEGRSGLTRIEDDAGVRWCGVVESLSELQLPDALRDYDCRQARLTYATWLGLADALARARKRWGAERVAVVLGTSTGGIAATEAAHAIWRERGRWPSDYSLEKQHAIEATLAVLRMLAQTRGPSYAISTACSSSAKALGAAKRLLDIGIADAVVTGGVDSLCRLTQLGFAGLELISTQPAKPLSSERAGINLGEGGALMLLERQGDAEVDLVSVGESNDAHHMSSPHPDGIGAALAMQRALAEGDVAPERVSYVNVHATGTAQGDLAEVKAIIDVLGPKARVVATKAYTGHLLGAAGATEAAFAALSIAHGWVPGSLNAQPLDPACSLEVASQTASLESDYVLSNSLAFGGSNAAVLLGARTP